MNVARPRPSRKSLPADARPRWTPAVHRFSPSDPPPSRRVACRDLSPEYEVAAASRVKFRGRFLWGDASAPSGVREEIVTFSNPRKVLDLLRRVQETPDRPLIGSPIIEAMVRPAWKQVPLDFVKFRAGQRQRIDDEKAAQRERRASEPKGGQR